MSKIAHGHKTFIAALKQVHQSNTYLKRYFNDKRLSYGEKQILLAWMTLKKSDFFEVVEILDSITSTKYLLVKVQQNLLYGIVYNNLGEFDKALQYFKQAISFLEVQDYPEVTFTVYFNLFITATNAGEPKTMQAALGQLEQLKPTAIHQKLALKESQFTYYSYIESYAKAEEYLIAIEQNMEQMTAANKLSFLISKFIFLVNINNMNQAMHTLEKLKKFRAFKLSSNYIFMKTLIDQLVDDKPIYLYEYQFKDGPLLFKQVQVIKYLSEGDITLAKETWRQLAEMNPKHYQDKFCYLGEKGLFSRCLLKYQDKIHHKVAKIDHSKSKTELIIEYLSNANAPLNKELLFELVWGRNVNSKDDLKILSALISKIKSRHNVNITYKNNSYSLSKKISA
jgi:tetratricopeptide (TPR) repeat protein